MQQYHQVFTEQQHNALPSQENVKPIVYQGSSMSSIFQDLDVLYYTPGGRIRPGNVVVIRIPDTERKVIHRVISTGKRGIRTMGDCNPGPDNWLLSQDQILGSVVYGYRGKQRFRVSGGSAGFIKMHLFRLNRLIIKTAYPVLSSLYRSFHISGLVILLIRPRKIAFKRPEGIELHLLARGRVIGRQLPGQKWQIKSPFKYFLDENSLPD